MQRKLILFLISICLYGAIPASTVWEVRPTVGSDTNGSAFDSTGTGTDMSQFNNKNATSCTSCQSATSNISTTDLTTTTTGSFTATSASAAFTTAITGNLIHLSGGTGGTVTTGFYRATYASATTITLDRSPGAAATSVTMNIGGAGATISNVNSNWVSSNICWVKATGTYTVTTALTITLDSHVAPGTPLSIIGYTSTRGDNGQFTWTTSTNSVDLVDFTTAINVSFQNIVMSSTAGTPGFGFNAKNSPNTSQGIMILNCNLSGFNIGIYGNWNVVQSFVGLFVVNSRITASVSHGIQNSGSTFIFGSILDNNGGDGANWSSGTPSLTANWTVENTVFYKNGANGLNFVSVANTPLTTNGPSFTVSHSDFSTNTIAGIIAGNAIIPFGNISNNIFDANGTYGIDGASGTTQLPWMIYTNAFYNNTTAATRNINAGIGTITLTANPYTTIGSNFALNSTSGGGAVLKAVGWPGITNSFGTGYSDIGALQSQGSVSEQVGFPIIQ